MKTRHNFEYKRHYKSMLLSFVCIMISQLLYIQYETVGVATKIYETNSDEAIKSQCITTADSDSFIKNLIYVSNEMFNIYF